MVEPSTRELLDTCVHCGFCLPACPTYGLWGDESDSPRGRIHLMHLLEAGELEWGRRRRGTSTAAWVAWRASRPARAGFATTS